VLARNILSLHHDVKLQMSLRGMVRYRWAAPSLVLPGEYATQAPTFPAQQEVDGGGLGLFEAIKSLGIRIEPSEGPRKCPSRDH